jgi:cbb3-type cytochrome oxidase subunit 3
MDRNLLYALFTAAVFLVYNAVIVFVVPFKSQRFVAMLMAGMVVFFIVLFFFLSRIGKGNSEEKARLLRDGMPGVATVLAAKQTGLFINKNPQVEMTLRVQPASGASYERTTKYVVPMFNASALQVNSTIKVKIDPRNSERLAIDEDWAK